MEWNDLLEIHIDNVQFWNPFGLGMKQFAICVALKSLGVILLDPIVLFVCRLLKVEKLSSRVPVPIMKGLERLEPKDYIFLIVNQIIETVAVMYFVQFALLNDQVKVSPSNVTIGNTVGFVYAAFVVDDFFYYFAHRFMHHRAVYALCHKHHHRQSMPYRGYYDAANEHPVEQLVGLGIVWITFQLLLQYSPFGVHAFGILAFFLSYAITAFLNHTEFDVRFGLFGMGYTVQAHEMHHRFPQCNFAQNTMLWDKLLGTFMEYRGNNKIE